MILCKTLNGWQQLAHLTQPATVKKWHRKAFRLFWRWKPRAGRARITREIQALIRQLSIENPLPAAGRIRDALALHGYEPLDDETIRKYTVKPRKPGKPSTTWLPFLCNHLEVCWAMDLFTVVRLHCRMLSVFIVLGHGRRQVIHFAASYHPTMAWVIRHLK